MLRTAVDKLMGSSTSASLLLHLLLISCLAAWQQPIEPALVLSSAASTLRAVRGFIWGQSYALRSHAACCRYRKVYSTRLARSNTFLFIPTFHHPPYLVEVGAWSVVVTARRLVREEASKVVALWLHHTRLLGLWRGCCQPSGVGL